MKPTSLSTSALSAVSEISDKYLNKARQMEAAGESTDALMEQYLDEIAALLEGIL